MSEIKWVDDQDIFGRLAIFTGNDMLTQLRNAAGINGVDLSDALSWGQLKSKRWLVTELEKLDLNLGTVFLCAGWYATLASMLFNSKCNVDKIRSFDFDPACVDIADTINKSQVLDKWKFKASTVDITDIQYPHIYTVRNTKGANIRLNEMPDCIINTSCEHIAEFGAWYQGIPNGKLVVLQTNNYKEISDHVNCSDSSEEFASITPMAQVLYEGVLGLPKYTRFMRIGIK